MFLLIVLLAVIVWLLWTLHQDMLEANQRQRNVKMELIRLVDRVEQLLLQHEHKAPATVARVGLNSASKTALRTLPKVGAVVAERIIDARPFSSVDQLRDVNGVTSSLFDTIVERVSLD
jgi:DNA uptake protein ComE-like DNA-binding protein